MTTGILFADVRTADTYFDQVEARFATSQDFTIGLEEEYQLLDPGTLALASRFEH